MVHQPYSAANTHLTERDKIVQRRRTESGLHPSFLATKSSGHAFSPLNPEQIITILEQNGFETYLGSDSVIVPVNRPRNYPTSEIGGPVACASLTKGGRVIFSDHKSKLVQIAAKDAYNALRNGN